MKQIQVTTSQGLFVAQILGAQGDWVVCWPGQALDHQSMLEFARLLAKEHRVVLIDSPAVGLNQHLPYTPALDDLVHYAHSLLMSLGIKRCHWVGLSSGGSVVCGLAC